MQKTGIVTRILVRKKLFIYLGIGVLVTGISLFFFVRGLIKPMTGLVAYYPEVEAGTEGIVFSPTDRSSPALDAGMKAGDIILSINDHVVSLISDIVNTEYSTASFDYIRIMVFRNDTELEILVRPEPSITRFDWIFLLFFLIILGATAFYLILNHSHEASHSVIAFLCLLYLFYICVTPFAFESAAGFFGYNAGELSGWILVIFCLALDSNIWGKVLKACVFIISTGMVLIFTALRTMEFANWKITGQDDGFIQMRQLTQIQSSLDIAVYIGAVLLLVVTYLRTHRQDIRTHIEWIASGALVALPPHFIFNQLPEIIPSLKQEIIPLGATSYLFLSFLPLLYLIGLTRSRGYRIQVFKKRAVFHVLLAFASITAFSLCFFPVQSFAENTLHLVPEYSGFLVSVLLLTVIMYLQFMAFILVDRKIMKEPVGTVPGQTPGYPTNDAYARFLSGISTRVMKFTREARKTLCKDNKKSNAFLEKEQDLDELCRELERTFGMPGNMIAIDTGVIARNAIIAAKQKYPDLEVSLSLPENRLRVLCCPEEIILVLTSLLYNSYEAQILQNTPIQMDVKQEGPGVFITVTDMGQGMTPRILSQAGQPFFSTKTGHDGLGLFLSRVILERNSADLSTKRAVGAGTVACVRLQKAR
ncbi:MAG: PDZ domain-containing protein [Spirochaetaceae bacterium]|nr:MAG: PDZ domain-containing protein [Spirochaetaceae bacterium]